MVRWIGYGLTILGVLGLIAWFTPLGAAVPVVGDLPWSRNAYILSLIIGAIIVMLSRQTSD